MAAAGLAGFAAGLPAAARTLVLGTRPHRWQRAAVAAGIGLVWLLITAKLTPVRPWGMPAYLALTYAGVLLAVIDARTGLLPDRLTGPAFVTVAAALTVASLATGDWAALGRGAAAAAVAGVVFLGLALARSGGLGMGDVKLAPTLALALGWLSWSAVLAGFVLAYLLAGLAAVAAVVFRGAGRKTMLPFGPWLVAGTVLALLTAGVPA